jgi:hypothetical protein
VWWETYSQPLDKVFDADKYLTAARIGAVAGETYQSAYDPDHGFGFGLARLLNGVATLIANR